MSLSGAAEQTGTLTSLSRPPLCGDLSIDDVPSDSLSDLSDDVFLADMDDAYFVEFEGAMCRIRGPNVNTVMSYDSGVRDTSCESSAYQMEESLRQHKQPKAAERLKLTRVGVGGGGGDWRSDIDEDEDVDDDDSDDDVTAGACAPRRYPFVPPPRDVVTRKYYGRHRPLSVHVNPAEIARAKAELFTLATTAKATDACANECNGAASGLNDDVESDVSFGSAGEHRTMNSEELFAKYYNRFTTLNPDVRPLHRQVSPVATLPSEHHTLADVLYYNTPVGSNGQSMDSRTNTHSSSSDSHRRRATSQKPSSTCTAAGAVNQSAEAASSSSCSCTSEQRIPADNLPRRRPPADSYEPTQQPTGLLRHRFESDSHIGNHAEQLDLDVLNASNKNVESSQNTFVYRTDKDSDCNAIQIDSTSSNLKTMGANNTSQTQQASSPHASTPHGDHDDLYDQPMTSQGQGHRGKGGKMHRLRRSLSKLSITSTDSGHVHQHQRSRGLFTRLRSTPAASSSSRDAAATGDVTSPRRRHASLQCIADYDVDLNAVGHVPDLEASRDVGTSEYQTVADDQIMTSQLAKPPDRELHQKKVVNVTSCVTAPNDRAMLCCQTDGEMTNCSGQKASQPVRNEDSIKSNHSLKNDDSNSPTLCPRDNNARSKLAIQCDNTRPQLREHAKTRDNLNSAASDNSHNTAMQQWQSSKGREGQKKADTQPSSAAVTAAAAAVAAGNYMHGIQQSQLLDETLYAEMSRQQLTEKNAKVSSSYAVDQCAAAVSSSVSEIRSRYSSNASEVITNEDDEFYNAVEELNGVQPQANTVVQQQVGDVTSSSSGAGAGSNHGLSNLTQGSVKSNRASNTACAISTDPPGVKSTASDDVTFEECSTAVTDIDIDDVTSAPDAAQLCNEPSSSYLQLKPSINTAWKQTVSTSALADEPRASENRQLETDDSRQPGTLSSGGLCKSLDSVQLLDARRNSHKQLAKTANEVSGRHNNISDALDGRSLADLDGRKARSLLDTSRSPNDAAFNSTTTKLAAATTGPVPAIRLEDANLLDVDAKNRDVTASGLRSAADDVDASRLSVNDLRTASAYSSTSSLGEDVLSVTSSCGASSCCDDVMYKQLLTTSEESDVNDMGDDSWVSCKIRHHADGVEIHVAAGDDKDTIRHDVDDAKITAHKDKTNSDGDCGVESHNYGDDNVTSLMTSSWPHVQQVDDGTMTSHVADIQMEPTDVSDSTELPSDGQTELAKQTDDVDKLEVRQADCGAYQLEAAYRSGVASSETEAGNNARNQHLDEIIELIPSGVDVENCKGMSETEPVVADGRDVFSEDVSGVGSDSAVSTTLELVSTDDVITEVSAAIAESLDIDEVEKLHEQVPAMVVDDTFNTDADADVMTTAGVTTPKSDTDLVCSASSLDVGGPDIEQRPVDAAASFSASRSSVNADISPTEQDEHEEASELCTESDADVCAATSSPPAMSADLGDGGATSSPPAVSADLGDGGATSSPPAVSADLDEGGATSSPPAVSVDLDEGAATSSPPTVSADLDELKDDTGNGVNQERYVDQKLTAKLKAPPAAENLVDQRQGDGTCSLETGATVEEDVSAPEQTVSCEGTGSADIKNVSGLQCTVSSDDTTELEAVSHPASDHSPECSSIYESADDSSTAVRGSPTSESALAPVVASLKSAAIAEGALTSEPPGGTIRQLDLLSDNSTATKHYHNKSAAITSANNVGTVACTAVSSDAISVDGGGSGGGVSVGSGGGVEVSAPTCEEQTCLSEKKQHELSDGQNNIVLQPPSPESQLQQQQQQLNNDYKNNSCSNQTERLESNASAEQWPLVDNQLHNTDDAVDDDADDGVEVIDAQVATADSATDVCSAGADVNVLAVNRDTNDDSSQENAITVGSSSCEDSEERSIESSDYSDIDESLKESESDVTDDDDDVDVDEGGRDAVVTSSDSNSNSCDSNSCDSSDDSESSSDMNTSSPTSAAPCAGDIQPNATVRPTGASVTKKGLSCTNTGKVPVTGGTVPVTGGKVAVTGGKVPVMGLTQKLQKLGPNKTDTEPNQKTADVNSNDDVMTGDLTADGSDAIVSCVQAKIDKQPPSCGKPIKVGLNGPSQTVANQTDGRKVSSTKQTVVPGADVNIATNITVTDPAGQTKPANDVIGNGFAVLVTDDDAKLQQRQSYKRDGHRHRRRNKMTSVFTQTAASTQCPAKRVDFACQAYFPDESTFVYNDVSTSSEDDDIDDNDVRVT